MNNKIPFETQPMATASTSHITEKDDALLTLAVNPVGAEGYSGVVVYETIPGYLIYLVPTENTEAALRKTGFSEAFITLVKEISDSGIRVFRLDPDGPEYEGLQKFMW